MRMHLYIYKTHNYAGQAQQYVYLRTGDIHIRRIYIYPAKNHKYLAQTPILWIRNIQLGSSRLTKLKTEANVDLYNS